MFLCNLVSYIYIEEKLPEKLLVLQHQDLDIHHHHVHVYVACTKSLRVKRKLR